MSSSEPGRILIVDDDEAARYVKSRLLRRTGNPGKQADDRRGGRNAHEQRSQSEPWPKDLQWNRYHRAAPLANVVFRSAKERPFAERTATMERHGGRSLQRTQWHSQQIMRRIGGRLSKNPPKISAVRPRILQPRPGIRPLLPGLIDGDSQRSGNQVVRQARKVMQFHDLRCLNIFRGQSRQNLIQRQQSLVLLRLCYIR